MNNTSHQSKSSLFIGDLAIFCTEEDIRRMFSPFGEISEVKIIKSEETSRNLSYGFITFVTVEAAAEALSRLNGQLLCGRPMRINWASYKNKPQGNIANGHSNQVNNNNNHNSNAHNNSSSHNNLNNMHNHNNHNNHNNNGAILRDAKGEEIETSAVHVSFISYQTSRLVTEESLRALYSKYGRVLDVSIKKSMIDRDISRQSGYGFVHYELTKEGVVSAVAAAKELTDTTIDDVNYKSSISHNLKKFIHSELEPTATPPSTTTSSNNNNNNNNNNVNHVNGIAQNSQNSNANYLYNNNLNSNNNSNNNTHPPPSSAVVYSTNNNHNNANNANSMQIAQMPMTQMYPNSGHPAVMNQVPTQMSMMTAPPMAPPPLPYAPPHHHLMVAPVQVSPVPSPVASYVALPPGVFLSAPPPPPPLPPNNNNNNNGTIMSPSPPVYYATTLNNLPPLPPNTTLNHNNNNHNNNNNNNNGYIMQQPSPLPSPVSPSRSLSQDSYREEFNRFMVSSLVSPVSYYTHSPATTVNTSSPLVNLQTAPLFPTVMLSADGSYPMTSPQQTLSNNMNNLNMNGNNNGNNNGNGNIMSQADLILQQRAGLSVARNIQASRYNNNSNPINNTINNNNNLNNNVTSTARARSSLLRQNLAMHSK